MISMFSYQHPSIEEHTWKNWSLSPYALPMCASYAILVHTFHVVLVHASCAHPVHHSSTSKEVSYTLDFSPNDSNHYLGNSKCGLWK